LTRAFLAIAPDDVLRKVLHRRAGDLAQTLGEEVRWVPTRNYHLTLVFAGERSRGDLGSIIAALHRVGRDYQPFQCRVEGLDLLPAARRPRALVARVVPCESLLSLQRELLVALGEGGLQFASEHYRPHITLARIKHRGTNRRSGGTKLSNWWAQQGGVYIQQEFPVAAVTLYQSELAPSAAVYRSLAMVKLGVV
jgi:2'-5' RNA ligase